MTKQQNKSILPSDKEFDRQLDWVAKSYLASAFDRRRAWVRISMALGQTSAGLRRRRLRYAAAIAAAVVLTASAAYIALKPESRPAPVQEPQNIEQSAPTEMYRTHRLDFSDTPLSQVVAKIETEYGVTVDNVPEGDYRLTGSFEGDAGEIVESINMLLGTEMEVVEK